MRFPENWLSIALIILTIVSIPSLHVLGFLAAMPSASRQFVDFRFSVGVGVVMAFWFALAVFFAGYLPKLLVGLIIFSHQATIDKLYYQRGYRRIYVSWTGIGNRARKLRNTVEERLKNLPLSA